MGGKKANSNSSRVRYKGHKSMFVKRRMDGESLDSFFSFFGNNFEFSALGSA